jgi:glycosyltransferase involved in cell wall biosynthesis
MPGHRRFIAVGSVSNPYVPMMYSQLDQHRFSVHFVHGLPGIFSALAEATATGEIPHLHLDTWFTAEEATKIVAALPHRATLSVTAHDLEYNVTRPDELSGARIILQRADAIHLLTSSSREYVLSMNQCIDERMFHVPHPSYVGPLGGKYALPQDRVVARRTLGRAHDEFAVGLVGRISDRKNVNLLIAAGEILQRDSATTPLPQLYISGSIASRRAESIVRSACSLSNVHLETDDLDDQMAGLHIPALDVAVVPYHAYLNSGWTLLALTAGLPVIASRTSTAQETVPPEALVLFEEGDAYSLAAAIKRSGNLDPTASRVAALARAEEVHPERVARQFAKELSARILQ